MNEQLKNKTLAQIVTDYNDAAPVLEKYHLDFCCRGKRTLEQACEEKKLEANRIIAEITSAIESDKKPTIQFENMSLTELSEYIVEKHHKYVRDKLPQLYVYLHKVASKHGMRHPELPVIFEKFILMKEELELHMQKEELILFPRIKELERSLSQSNQPTNISPGFILSPVHVMETEHEHAGNLLGEMSSLPGNFTAPADACTTYKLSFDLLRDFEADLHQHIHLENNILFPKATTLINTLSKAELN